MLSATSRFTRDPVTFWVRPPGRWQLFFWGTFAALCVPGALAWSDEPLSSGRLILALGLIGVFFAFYVVTWRKIHRTKNYPALRISGAGLEFWPGSSLEKHLSWQQLKGISFGSGGGEGWIAFDTVDNRHLGSTVFLLLPTPITVPVSAKAGDGARLDVWVEEYLLQNVGMAG